MLQVYHPQRSGNSDGLLKRFFSFVHSLLKLQSVLKSGFSFSAASGVNMRDCRV